MRIRFTHLKGFTGREDDAFLSEFVVEDGRFRLKDAAPVDETVDLGGAVVMPAFIEAHSHPMMLAEAIRTVACVPPNVNSIEEMIAKLKASDMADGNPERWIEGWGYDENLLAEGRSPSRADLDCVSTTQPVMIRRSDYHTCCVNSKALELAGITRETPDPVGAKIGRDGRGDPNGLLIETGAVALIERVKPAATVEDAVEDLLLLKDHYLSHGYLATTEMMPLRKPGAADDPLMLYRKAVEKGLPLAVNLYCIWAGGTDPFGMPDLSEDEKTGAVRYAGVKLFGDGSISGRTAAMRTNYVYGPDEKPENPSGFMTLTEGVFRAGLAYAKRNGVQVSIHVMGDRSIDVFLDWLEGEEPWLPEGIPSVRFEHVSLLRPDHLERMRAMPMTFGLTTQVIFPFAEWRSYRKVLSPEVFESCYAVKTITDDVFPLALSSDAPATTWSDPDQVFTSVEAAVTRRDASGGFFGEKEAVSVKRALSLYTSMVAEVMPLPAGMGLIEEGAPANFVLLDADPFVDAAARGKVLGDIRTAAVYKDGAKIWQKA